MTMTGIQWINLLAILLEYVVSITAVIVAAKYFRYTGLIVIGAIFMSLSNVIATKVFSIYGDSFSMSVGSFMCSTPFAIYSILVEIYGVEKAKKGMLGMILGQIAFLCATQVALFYKPGKDDFISPAMAEVFGFVPRIMIAGWVAMIVSGLCAIQIYHLLGRNKWLEKHIGFRNNIATKISQLIDNIIFLCIAFIGVFEWRTLLSFLVLGAMLEYLFDYLDTWSVIMSVKILRKDPIVAKEVV